MKLSLVKVRIVANESQKLTRQILKISRQPKMKNELQASFFKERLGWVQPGS
jgi:hypothetical protein